MGIPDPKSETPKSETEITRKSTRVLTGDDFDDAYFPRVQVEDSLAAEFPIFPALVSQLSDRDPAVRGSACWSLGQLRYRPVIRTLGRILGKDEDSLVRVQAAQALAKMKCSASAQALIRGLKDPDELVREVCILGLGTLRDVQGIFPLESMREKLGEDQAELRRRLDWAIAELKAVAAPALRPDRRRGGVSRKITQALEHVHKAPRDGIAHNNLAVAYFHAAEHPLAVRHCLLAKELGARVEWLWNELVEVGCDPAEATISPADRDFLEGRQSDVLHLEPEPQRTGLGQRRDGEGGDEESDRGGGVDGGEDSAEDQAPAREPSSLVRSRTGEAGYRLAREVQPEPAPPQREVAPSHHEKVPEPLTAVPSSIDLPPEAELPSEIEAAPEASLEIETEAEDAGEDSGEDSDDGLEASGSGTDGEDSKDPRRRKRKRRKAKKRRGRQ